MPSESNNPSSATSGSVPTPPKPTQVPPRPWPPAPLAPGVDPKSPKTANKAYDKVVADMLAEAQHKFECLLFVEDAYPDIGKQVRWSYKCWEEVCGALNNYFELSKDILSLIKGRCSHGRGAVLQRICPVIDGLFKITGNATTASRKNAEAAKNMLEKNAFYYVGHRVGGRRLEGKTMMYSLRAAFFAGTKSPAALNCMKFNPVPSSSVALACTLIQHCLHEWESGVKIRANLDEITDSARYRIHLNNHLAWKQLDDNKTDLILQHLSRKLFDSCNVKLKGVETTSSVPMETLEKEKAEMEAWNLYDTEEEV